MTLRRPAVLCGLGLGVVVFAILTVTIGSADVAPADAIRVALGRTPDDPSAQVLVGRVRLPRALTAACAGAALGVAGLQMQTLFRNPLADPFSLGVSAGASLGVSLLLTGAGAAAGASFGAGLGIASRVGTVAAAAVGAGAVLSIVLALSRFVRVPATLLIIGIMVGSAVTAFVSLMLTSTDPRRAQQFIAWGLGSFSGTTGADLQVLAVATALGLLAAAATVKPLNALLLGEGYARSLGVNVVRARFIILAGGSLLTGVVTAFCGPIGFIGIAVPHAARRLLGTSDHLVLLPATALTGMSAALACTVVSIAPGQVIPINVITSLVGAPIVVAILLRSRSVQGVSA